MATVLHLEFCFFFISAPSVSCGMSLLFFMLAYVKTYMILECIKIYVFSQCFYGAFSHDFVYIIMKIKSSLGRIFEISLQIRKL